MTPTLDTAVAVGATVALAILPGLALLRMLGCAPREPVTRFGLAGGLGLALVPLLWLYVPALEAIGFRNVQDPIGWLGVKWWNLLFLAGALLIVRRAILRAPQRTDGVGDRPTPGTSIGTRSVAMIRLLVERYLQFLQGWPIGDPLGDRSNDDGARRHGAAGAALLLVLAVQLTARWYAARDVNVPLWADSVHHAMIVELFARGRTVPVSWQPLAPLATFSYHFGFHGLAAAVDQMTGLGAARSVVVTGQALMVLQSLTVAGLAAGLTRRPWAGVAAAVVAGGLGPMPGTYLTWGRYPQLAGQAVLPAAIFATIGAVCAPAGVRRDGRSRPRVGPAVVAATAVAGLALTHYVVTVFFVIAVGAWWLIAGSRSDGVIFGPPAAAPWRTRGTALARLVVIALAAFALALPWLPRFLAGNVDTSAAALVTTALPDGSVWGMVSLAYVADHFAEWVGLALTVTTVVAIAFGLARRDRTVAFAAVWIAGLVAASYPQALGLPITGPLKDFTVLIGLYIPAAVAIGAVAGRAVDAYVARPNARAAAADDAPGDIVDDVLAAARGPSGHALFAAVALAAVLGWRQRDVIQPDRVIVTPADEHALTWVRDHTPPDAVFLASAQPTYGDTVPLGEDGGWWLPVLAGRACTVPPLPIGHEQTVEPDYRERTVALAKAVAADLAAPDTIARLQREHVTHAYVGPTAKTLRTTSLAAAGWTSVFDEDGASVWRAPWTAP